MKRLVLLSLCFAFFSWIGLQLGISNTAGKPGLAGAPGDNGTCGNCHNSSPLAPLNENISVTINGDPLTASFEYDNSATYAMRLSIDNPLSIRGGFSLTVLDENNEMAGALSTIDGNAQLYNQNNRTYVAQNSNAATAWDFTWAPNGVNGEVTFYASVNDANNNGQFSGDIIRPYELKINPAATTSIEASTLEEAVSIAILGNQIQLNADNSLPYPVTARLLSINGAQSIPNTALTPGNSSTFDASALPKGIYILHLDAKTSSHTQMISLQ
ncbi:MAG: choice-of-anchor V domain-containing protein [Chitinophagales bacterium]